MKPFKTLDEQYQILLGRGMNFSDIDKAKKYLLENNYYNVINCYSKFFIDTGDNYLLGTTFDEITKVHFFDKELKNTLFKYIIEIEKHLKSIVSYRFSETYPTIDYAYLIATSYKPDDILQVTALISSISNLINKELKNKNPNPIKHYINQHGSVPFWIISNYMTFGQLVKFYQHLPITIQNKIAKDFSSFLNENLGTNNQKLQPHELISFLNNIVELRNIVAHNNKVLGFKCKNNTTYINTLHSKCGIQANNQRQDVYNVFIVMQALLTKNQYAQLNNTIRKRARTLNKELKTISCNVILSSLGFPTDWFNQPSLQQ